MNHVESIKVTKMEAAAKQLSLAVWLFFDEHEPIAIETLVGAASGVLNDLASKHGAKSILYNNERIKPEKMKQWHDLLREPQNYFKHADRDSDVAFYYKPQTLRFKLLEACDLFKQLGSDKHLKYGQLKEGGGL